MYSQNYDFEPEIYLSVKYNRLHDCDNKSWPDQPNSSGSTWLSPIPAHALHARLWM